MAPNCSAKPKGEQRLAVADEVAALRDQAALSLRRPVDRGFVVNPHLQRDIWDRLFRKVLKACPPRTRRRPRPPTRHAPT